MKKHITGLVLTYNGERLLDKCLQSLSFCDQILVVDSNSADATVQIAQDCGAKVLTRKWEGPAPQFRYALENINSCWVVSLDQDEICSSDLKESILSAIEKDEDVAGYYVNRRNWYFDRFMKYSGWYPDRLLRVFRPEKLEIKVSGSHYSFHPKGNTGRLPADIIHYPYESFSQHLDKINQYAEEGARDLPRKGRKGGVARGIAHGLGRFAKIYLLKRGILDGKAGFINAAHGAFYAFLKYVRVEEASWGVPYDDNE